VRETQEVFYQRVSHFLTEKTSSLDNYAYIRYEQKS
jgi:hypothetical protein